jgi:hypothetical protein
LKFEREFDLKVSFRDRQTNPHRIGVAKAVQPDPP